MLLQIFWPLPISPLVAILLLVFLVLVSFVIVCFVIFGTLKVVNRGIFSYMTHLQNKDFARCFSVSIVSWLLVLFLVFILWPVFFDLLLLLFWVFILMPIDLFFGTQLSREGSVISNANPWQYSMLAWQSPFITFIVIAIIVVITMNISLVLGKKGKKKESI